jgi:hypothetical protein
MPAYDLNFRPPAPVALVTLHVPSSGTTIANVPMLLDTGADVSLVPRAVIADARDSSESQYELEAFDGMKTTAPSVHLEMQFLAKLFRGLFLIVDSDYNIIGRNILNNVSLRFDGPSRKWTEL